jgi:CBS domain-containing protein
MPQRPVSTVIQNREFVTSTPEKSVYSIAAHMRSYGAAAVLVVDQSDGSLLGICTERDLVFKVVADALDAKTTTVGDIMTADPLTISPDKPFGHALHLMFEGGFRHLPVVDASGRPVGVLSSRDALGLEAFHFHREVEQRETLTEIL